MLGARPAEGEGMAAGDVVNTAARLQAAAPVNGILVGERTFRATRAGDRVPRRPSRWRRRARGSRCRSGRRWRRGPGWGLTSRTRRRTALVGRDRELAVLRDALARVRAERSPQLVTLVGVPGIGKSRLLYELSQDRRRGG